LKNLLRPTCEHQATEQEITLGCTLPVQAYTPHVWLVLTPPRRTG